MITKEEALRRQKERGNIIIIIIIYYILYCIIMIILNLIIVSKHNVLLSTVTPTKSRANIKRNIKHKKPVSSSSSSLTYKHKEMNSLDLVNRG